eukprot:tig00000093_g3614.t1
MLSDNELYSRFLEHASFGQGNAGADTMDNARFAKFCKDIKIVDTRYTSTSVDLVFNRCKTKGERRLTFDQFKRALSEIANEKYAGDLSKVHALVRGGSATTNGSTPTATRGNIFDRLTDHTKYTGVYKQRFDEQGNGRGVHINGYW